MLAIQMVGPIQRDEELAAIVIRAIIRHGDDAASGKSQALVKLVL